MAGFFEFDFKRNENNAAFLTFFLDEKWTFELHILVSHRICVFFIGFKTKDVGHFNFKYKY